MDAYEEEFGLPSCILDIGSWDHTMIVMWAEAVNLSPGGCRRLEAASDLRGVDLVNPSVARAALEMILDHADLNEALSEIEALLVLKRLQPGTRVFHAPSCDTISGDDGYLTSATPQLMSSGSNMLSVECWLAKLQEDMQALYAQVDETEATSAAQNQSLAELVPQQLSLPLDSTKCSSSPGDDEHQGNSSFSSVDVEDCSAVQSLGAQQTASQNENDEFDH